MQACLALEFLLFYYSPDCSKTPEKLKIQNLRTWCDPVGTPSITEHRRTLF
jgi:hypothetical protein